VEYAVGEQPDVIVLDVMMPGMDGWEVLSHLKTSPDPLVQLIPIIMLTARADDLDRIRGGIEGAIRYLTKPFSPSELRREVVGALEGDELGKRRKAQTDALEQLARLESGSKEPVGERSARPHITRLERPHDVAAAAKPSPPRLPATKLGQLSEKQRELLDAVAETPTVSEAAHQLKVSRSNVYASLRRIARKLDVRSVPELVTLVRGGALLPEG
jgi:DNA-binding NarL/FixJ family response regulator